MNETSLMRVMHGIADLHHHLQPIANVQMSRLRIVPGRLATDQFHREIGLRSEARIHRTGFIDLSDARMLQSAERLRFLFEPAQQFRAWPFPT